MDEPTEPEIPQALLSVMCCPLTRSPLHQEGDFLVAEEPNGAGLRYPIRDGIPVMLIDEAELPEGVDSIDEFKARYAEVIAD